MYRLPPLAALLCPLLVQLARPELQTNSVPCSRVSWLVCCWSHLVRPQSQPAAALTAGQAGVLQEAAQPHSVTPHALQGGGPGRQK